MHFSGMAYSLCQACARVFSTVMTKVVNRNRSPIQVSKVVTAAHSHLLPFSNHFSYSCKITCAKVRFMCSEKSSGKVQIFDVSENFHR